LAIHADRASNCRASFVLAGLLALASCAGPGQFVWVDQYRDPGPSVPGPYILAPGDVIQVRVFNQEGMSARTRIRDDGMITLPFLNDVRAAGYEPSVFAQQMQARLKDFINEPVVTVSVEEPRGMNVVVVGAVGHPGIVQLPQGSGVLAAIVSSGGLNDFADDERIFVVRREPQPTRIRFTYKALLKPIGAAGAFHLRSGDLIVVE
jgi:polysaccharide export outer membrane protein